MTRKAMLEATQSVVDGNEVVVHSGTLYASMDKVPEGVTVKPVLADVPDEKPAPKADPPKPETPPKPPQAKPGPR